MKKYRGPVLEVSPVHATPGTLGGWMIDRIRIGDKTLRYVNVDDVAATQLRPDGREVCLYVLRLPIGAVPFPLTPFLLGMKFMDTGEKLLIPFSFARNSCIRYAVIPALVWSIGGAIAGFAASWVFMVIGVTNEMFLASLPGLAFFGGLLLAWGCSLRLALDYLRARID